MQAAVPPVFDAAHFGEMTGDDPGLQREVVGLFAARAEEWRAAFAPGGPQAGWPDAAHTLKGSSRSMGLWRLAQACERAEQADEAPRAALTALLAELEAALAALAPYAHADSTEAQTCVMRKAP